MSRPTNLLKVVSEMQSAGGDFGGAAGGPEQSYCAAERVIPFRLADGASPQVGDEARLQLGSPPAVIVSGSVVGAVSEPHAQAMSSCLRMGYRMIGVIASVHPAEGKATVSVTGERAQVA